MSIPATEQLPDDGMVVVGRVAGPHGVGGLLRILSFTRPVENLLNYAPWSFHRDGAWREVAVCPDSARRHDNSFLCRVDGVDDREAAAALRGVLIGVPETALPESGPDEFYWRDLIGLDVVTPAGDRFGRVENLMATGANDALIVNDGENERLIPFIATVVTNVDLDRSVIVVDWEDPV